MKRRVDDGARMTHCCTVRVGCTCVSRECPHVVSTVGGSFLVILSSPCHYDCSFLSVATGRALWLSSTGRSPVIALLGPWNLLTPTRAGFFSFNLYYILYLNTSLIHSLSLLESPNQSPACARWTFLRHVILGWSSPFLPFIFSF